MPKSGLGEGERIAKHMARAGLCSRREAERMIAAGRVAVDGRTLETPAFLVTASSAVTVDGKPIGAAKPAELWRYHKPPGLITSHDDPQGRVTVFQSLPKDLGRVLSVGRLDLASEGLLLLTNDGGLSRRLERSDWLRRYRVRVHGRPDEARLKALAKGVTVDGVRYGPIAAALDSTSASNAWLTLGLKEGKNREVRRVLEHLGLQVNRLIRTAYGPFQLGSLKRGQVAHIAPKVVREQLGNIKK
ncbi:MAG TPA: pseudouridine synthase [Alphaproteobacteria bacterium]|jgi:23S rRNA pseudouridine2605 synthase|nr:pseudouridine synthase [Alphaproteobacteria bacterium]HJN60016.1 pseudouridine synthase [Alphaproteobacteria bacterium]